MWGDGFHFFFEKKEDALKTIENNLNSPSVKLLNDTIIIKEIVPVHFNLKAHLILKKNMQVDKNTLDNIFRERLSPHLKIGCGITKSVLTSLLFADGITDIRIEEPTQNITVKDGELLQLKDFRVTHEIYT